MKGLDNSEVVRIVNDRKILLEVGKGNKCMRIYLDNCCYNRPYDDQSQITVSLETQAKLYIQTVAIVEAEQFISLIIREKLDYTKWQRDYFDAKKPEDISKEAVEYAKTNPYKGKALRL